ncbi:ATP-dependent RNA helicase DDX47/RRP3 [Entomortierella parvispora]|uniref:ATP-dependent rRNA helicase RRP3 n=1 Tax=Entomortierella parvispora TaxID=205924 RepID=A0A9P3HFN7_9FUNG|nr:ATP-dependent RNA helicase DDX47/RRP3 [Entomortierella parvispora]
MAVKKSSAIIKTAKSAVATKPVNKASPAPKMAVRESEDADASSEDGDVEKAEENVEAESSKEESAEASSENITFKDLGLMQPLVDACQQLNFKAPTEIQRESIPWSLQGRDIIGLAQTGSGKTAAFALPILQALWNNPSPMFACVMAPTRELAVQISETFESLGSTIGVRCVVIVGGMDMMAQSIALSKKPHIIVCTPGRLQDHLENTKGFSLRTLKYLVLDEADRLLDMDFGPIIDQILKVIPKERNTFLFSATMTTKVAKLQRASLNNPVKVEVATKYSTVSTLLQYYLFFPLKQKDSYLVYLLNELAGNSTIVFSRTCNETQRITLLLRNLGFPAIPLHGQLSQEKRLGALNKFKSGNRNILIATDVASRGLDIPSVDIVLNYDLPNNSKDYIHRVGRTARAGRSGKSITFVTQYDVEIYQRIEQALDKKLDEFPADKEAVMLLQERVAEAQRFAVTELKEQHASQGKGGRGGKKRLFNQDDNDRDDDSVQAGGYKSKSGAARGNRAGKQMRK